MSASPLHRFPWGLVLLSLLALILGLFLNWLGREELQRGNRLAFLFIAVHYAVAIYGASRFNEREQTEGSGRPGVSGGILRATR